MIHEFKTSEIKPFSTARSTKSTSKPGNFQNLKLFNVEDLKLKFFVFNTFKCSDLHLKIFNE